MLWMELRKGCRKNWVVIGMGEMKVQRVQKDDGTHVTGKKNAIRDVHVASVQSAWRRSLKGAIKCGLC